MRAVYLPRLESQPAVEVFARNGAGPYRGSHHAVGVPVQRGGVMEGTTGRVVQA